MRPLIRGLPLLFLLALPSPSAAEEGEPSARELFMGGLELFQGDNYAEALESFQRSYAANPVNVVLYNIAMCQRALFRYVESINSFERYLAVGEDDLPAERRQQVAGLIEDMRGRIGTLRITVTPPEATVRVDGELIAPEQLQSLWLSSGLHRVAARAPGYGVAEDQVQVIPQVVTEVNLALERTEPEPTPPVVPPVIPDGSGATEVNPAALENGEADSAGRGEVGGDRSRWWIWMIVGGAVLATGLGLGLGLGLQDSEDPFTGTESNVRLP